MFGVSYPRKPLTPQQVRENRSHASRTGKAQAEYEGGKQDLRDRLEKKYGVQFESEPEGDWYVVGQFSPPHVAPVDEDVLTDEQRKSWEQEKEWSGTMRLFYQRMADQQTVMLKYLTKDALSAEDGKTIKWVRYGDLTSTTAPMSE